MSCLRSTRTALSPDAHCAPLQLGFKLKGKDASNKMFVIFELQRERQVAPKQVAAVPWPELRPCVYKRR